MWAWRGAHNSRAEEPRWAQRTARAVGGAALALLLATLVLVAECAGPAAAATSAALGDDTGALVGIRLLDVPADSVLDPRARLYIVDHVAPGSTVTRRIVVTNGQNSSQQVSLYPAAATIKGGSFIGDAGHGANDLSSWTTVSPPSSTISATTPTTATVTITVPKDAAPGEHYGVVWAEVSSPASTEGGVTVTNRVGIRIYLSVGPGGKPAADFAITTLRAGRTSGGLPRIVATVRNTGGRALDLSGSLSLSDGPGGLRAGPFTVKVSTTIALKSSAPVSIVLDERVPAGPWLATITLHSGLVERSESATVTFPAHGSGVGVDVRAKFGWPLAIGGGAVLVMTGAVALALRRRTLRRRRDQLV